MNLNPGWSTIISIVFLILGGGAVYTMLAAQGRRHPPDYQRFSLWHRLAGWSFAGLFLFMFISMLQRVENFWEESPPRIALHVTFAVGLVLLLALKAAIPRRFPKLLKHMFALGTTIYLLAFTMVWITAGYYLIRRYEQAPYLSHAEQPAHILDANLGKQLFISKCGTCHLLRSIMQPRSREAWEEVINRMIELAAPRISMDEGAQILNYLVLTHTPRPYRGAPDQATMEERYCLPCHRAADLHQLELSRARWRQVVQRMHRYDPRIIPAEEIETIVDYLAESGRDG